MKKDEDIIKSFYENIQGLEALVDLHHRNIVDGRVGKGTKDTLMMLWSILEYQSRPAIFLLEKEDIEKKNMQLNRMATIRYLINSMQK